MSIHFIQADLALIAKTNCKESKFFFFHVSLISGAWMWTIALILVVLWYLFHFPQSTQLFWIVTSNVFVTGTWPDTWQEFPGAHGFLLGGSFLKWWWHWVGATGQSLFAVWTTWEAQCKVASDCSLLPSKRNWGKYYSDKLFVFFFFLFLNIYKALELTPMEGSHVCTQLSYSMGGQVLCLWLLCTEKDEIDVLFQMI